MYNFKNAIIDTITLYTMHDTYKEKILSLARALEHYVKLKDEFDLIESKDLEKIKELYKNFFIKK